ncbi:MAG: isoprenylcysteine carboxylmethyltransferase family protein [Cellvibrionaceae bacterium]|nr:isoprenylcysteine carboxylmethyltransferase family protein [Cellvibrionaceae bacterium]
MKFLETKIPPPLVMLISGAIMYGLAQWWPDWQFELPYRLWLIVPCLAVGLYLGVDALRAFRRAHTTFDPLHPERSKHLVVVGSYRFTRNPMYLSLLLALVAWGLYLGNGAALMGWPLFIIYMERFQIRPEERALAQKFGQPYLDYLTQVRRWF